MTCKSCGSVMRQGAQICHECQYNHLLGRQMGNRTQSPGVEKPVEAPRPVIRRRTEVETVSTIEVEDNLIRFPYSETVKSPLPESPPSQEVPEWRQQLRERVKLSRERRGMVDNDGLDQIDQASAGRDEMLTDRNPIVESALKRIKQATSAVTTLPVANRTGGSTSSSARAVKAIEPAKPLPTAAPPEPERPVLKQTTTENVRSLPTPVEERTTPPPPRAGWRREKIRPRVAEVSDTPSGPLRPAPVAELAGRSETAPPGDHQQEKLLIEREPVPRQGAAIVPQPEVEPEVAHPAESAPPPPEELKSTGEVLKNDGPRQDPASPAPRKVIQRPVRTTGKLRPEDRPVATQIIEVPQVFSSTAGTKGQPATFWVRTLAGGCDFEIISLSFLPIFASYAILNTILESETLLLMAILLSGLAFIYYAVTLLMAGRTFGMAMLNLRLVPLGDEAQVVTRRQRLLRAWASTIALLLPPLNLLVRATTAQHLSLPDLISKTVPVEN
ncbi:MAG: RDD family protein [Acidobacteriota bacterium]